MVFNRIYRVSGGIMILRNSVFNGILRNLKKFHGLLNSKPKSAKIEKFRKIPLYGVPLDTLTKTWTRTLKAESPGDWILRFESKF